MVDAELEDVVLVLRGGEVLYGDDALLSVDALRAACEALDVCGVAKRACVDQELGGTLDAARAHRGRPVYYPLFFCGEPTTSRAACRPAPDYPNGITVSDADGDGIDDAATTARACSTRSAISRPRRATPTATTPATPAISVPARRRYACALVMPNDFDDDGWSNGVDNCPRSRTTSRPTADLDGHGDACDGCRCRIPAPRCARCRSRRSAIRCTSTTPPSGAGSITGAYVTALRPDSGGSRGFNVQTDR